jgi:hypothetical protein
MPRANKRNQEYPRHSYFLTMRTANFHASFKFWRVSVPAYLCILLVIEMLFLTRDNDGTWPPMGGWWMLLGTGIAGGQPRIGADVPGSGRSPGD